MDNAPMRFRETGGELLTNLKGKKEDTTVQLIVATHASRPITNDAETLLLSIYVSECFV